ncbi:MAG TPA: ATP-dependent DNA ligase [Thermoanaerobaculia bacterium]|nr:ATP-dependent DNA ligase [Thermoanaerobaculia bacterium]
MARPSSRKKTDRIAAAVPAEALEGEFPQLGLPIQPPYPPMEARPAERIPQGEGWLYEPKWDGFRCLAFRKGSTVALQSKSGQPLDRYFPELVEAFGALPPRAFVLDGEIVIRAGDGLDFDALLQRIHPAESRIRKLARETPASYQAFDVLVDGKGKSVAGLPLEERRQALEKLFAELPEGGSVMLSPATADRALAERWIQELGASGLDGVVAKLAGSPYLPGDRSAMVKVKRIRTADCVVGGFRWAQAGGKNEGKIGSLLLGLYDDAGLLDHVGFSSSFTEEERRELEPVLLPLREAPGFTGKAPGGPSRWSQGRSTEWEPLRPALVCEVRYDHFTGGRFRHGTKFLRWRPDKKPEQCTFEQLGSASRTGPPG